MKTVLAALLLSTSAFADVTYRCGVQSYSDYSVEVNFTSKKAAFFDNDSWSVVKQTASANRNVAVFAGMDNTGYPIVVSFDVTGKTSFIRFVEQSGTKTKALINCEATRLYSDI